MGTRRKLLLLVTLVYAFLLSLLAHEYDLVRQGLLDRWSHRTVERARKTRAPLLPLALGTQPLVATLSTLLHEPVKSACSSNFVEHNLPPG